VFRAAYDAIEQALENADTLLLGSLYWKWWFPLFGASGEHPRRRPCQGAAARCCTCAACPAAARQAAAARTAACMPDVLHLPPVTVSHALLMAADTYGIKAGDSTSDIIAQHSKKVRSLINQTPPRPGCVMPVKAAPTQARMLGAWFPSASKGVCVNIPEAALAWHALYGPNAVPGATAKSFGFSETATTLADALSQGQTLVFATEAACCR